MQVVLSRFSTSVKGTSMRSGSVDAIHSVPSNLEKTIDYCSVFIGLHNNKL